MEVKVKSGHPIDTFKKEHDMILAFLGELEKINLSLQRPDNYGKDKEELRLLVSVAEHLVGAEPHHQREEETLFPELSKRGLSAPPKAMLADHKQLRPQKKELLRLSKAVAKMNFDYFKEELNQVTDSLVSLLREHIFKENEILYPLSLEMIKEEEVWNRIKEECDKIGYCCFTTKSISASS